MLDIYFEGPEIYLNDDKYVFTVVYISENNFWLSLNGNKYQ